MMMHTVFSSVAASLDGYIASRTGDLSWLNDVMKPDEDYGFAEMTKRTGALVIGSNTYEEMITSGMAGGTDRVPTYVVTRKRGLLAGTMTQFYSGDLRVLIEKISAETHGDICVWGGGSLITQCIDQGLLREIQVAIIPVLLGDGVRLFGTLGTEKTMHLTALQQFPSGIVVARYEL